MVWKIEEDEMGKEKEKWKERGKTVRRREGINWKWRKKGEEGW